MQPSQPAAQAPAGQAATGAAPAAGGAQADLAEATRPRVRLDNGRLHGSVSLLGGRIDQVTLADYHETIDPIRPRSRCSARPAGRTPTSPSSAGWRGTRARRCRTRRRSGRPQGGELTAQSPVTLTWDNGQGLAFGQQIGVDQDYMFSVKQTVTNNGTAPATLYPFGLLSRWGTPPTLGYYILHEGPIGVVDGSLQEIKYKTLAEKGTIEADSKGGWLGITDKYWLATLIPQQDLPIKTGFRHETEGDRYQTDFRGPA